MSTIATHRDRAYQFIREKITDGSLGPGHKVSDVSLAKTIGVSRTPVREAIGRLESEGLVEQVPRFGAFVRQLTRKELEDYYDLRILLEAYAVEKAADRMSLEDIYRLQKICDRQHELVRELRRRGGQRSETPSEHDQEWVSLDVAFHTLILRGSGNEQVSKIIADFRIMTAICGERRSIHDSSYLFNQAITWAGHQRILRCLRKGDGQRAAGMIRQHITGAKLSALKHFDINPQGGRRTGEAWQASLDRLLSRVESGQSFISE